MKRIILTLSCLFLASCAPSYILTPYMEGDCVDRAIMIRQELRQQGYEARLILGIVKEGDQRQGHAWVEYKDKESGQWIRIDNYNKRKK